MDKSYSPRDIESRIYAAWEAAGWFAPVGDGPPYCIVIPPPNVTGTLHMGHAFQHTLMDVLTRLHRMDGDRTLWQPGTDHAGIATQMVVERQLAADGRTRHDLGREQFVERVWEWKEESGGTISRQMRRLGNSVDWSRDRFTMDEGLSEAVLEVFVRLHEDGLIYRGKRLVNWDPVLHTALSDLEVIAEPEAGSLWHLRYPLADGSGHMIVATTRPETMLGDAAVAVNPADERYQHLVGRQVRLPLTGRLVPIIADDYCDPAFGSGCVKITPAHDFNDYEIGKRHSLPMINIFTADATLNDEVPARYRGLDRFEARQRVVAELEAAGLLEKIDPHTLPVPRGDRSGAVLEPWLTDQWYVRIAPLAAPAIAAVEDGRIRFVPTAGRRPISSGCATSRTGASAASSGGATEFPRGTTRKATSSSLAAKRRRRPRRPGSMAGQSRCGRTRTCSTRGSARRCGRSRRSAGRGRRRNSQPSTPPRCWSPASTSSSSGSPG